MLESSKVPALTRAIDILNLIARKGPCSAATIIETLGIPKSTAYLLLNELKRQRFISVDHQDNFCLWTKLVELSEHALSKMDLRELARPRLTQLMDETGYCVIWALSITKALTTSSKWSPRPRSVSAHTKAKDSRFIVLASANACWPGNLHR